MKSAAYIDPTGIYRYWLTRTWDENKPRVCFIMLNPSTADAVEDDPTIRRCIAFAKAWGYGGIIVVNLFAMRTPDPKVLHTVTCTGIDVVGPDNDYWIKNSVHNAALVVAAWGVNGCLLERGAVVQSVIAQLHHLGLTKAGHPKHPLYLPGKTRPTLWVKE